MFIGRVSKFKNSSLRLIFALYGLIGFILLTEMFSSRWTITSPQPYLYKIILFVALFFLLFIFPTGRLRQKELYSSVLPGWDIAVRGILVFFIFDGITLGYWWGIKTWQPALFGVTPLFATLLIWIDVVRADYVIKEERGIIPEGSTEYDSKMEYLKLIHNGYFWKIKVSMSAFFGVAVAFSWKAGEYSFTHQEVFSQVSWGMIFAAYGSIGILLIANQFLTGILNMIESEILKLEKGKSA